MDPRPPTSVHYPPFKHGRYFEEYFHDFWASSQAAKLQRFVYVAVFWHNLFNNHTAAVAAPLLAPAVQEVCEAARKQGRVPFTVCQWDDGPCLGPAKPDNLVVFSLGQSVDVPMPLIVEDVQDKLRKVPRLPFEQRAVLCSFVGSITHPVRRRMVQELAGVDGVELHVMPQWRVDVPKEAASLFVSTTQRSKFALAPRGYGPSSFRFFEAIQLGVVPVYIHDGDNALPFRDVVDYSRFAVVLHVDEVCSLPGTLAAIGEAEYAAMLAELEAAAHHFTMLGACHHVVRILETYHAG